MSFEPAPLTMDVATPVVATTLVQYRSGDGRIATLLVESYDSDFAVGVDLASFRPARFWSFRQTGKRLPHGHE